ncbi:MAG: hypothetical protein U0X40_02835 [Ferruginibacter sp.]
MKRIHFWALVAVAFVGIISCSKEYSLENSGNINDPLIVGADCRISKIAYLDSATGTGKGSVSASINSADQTTQVIRFDSLSATIDFLSDLNYFIDTIYIDPDQYFLYDLLTKRVTRLHGLIDPTVPSSLQFDADYYYDASGFLIQKAYSLTSLPGSPYYIVNYTYNGGNMVHMTGVETSTGDLVTDADMDYWGTLSPKNYIYIFPDELSYANFTQFLNFGKRNVNAIKNLKVRYYDPGNVLRDSTVSNFRNYMLSKDNYVLSVIMKGDDQFCIPADSSKLVFSYKCK